MSSERVGARVRTVADRLVTGVTAAVANAGLVLAWRIWRVVWSCLVIHLLKVVLSIYSLINKNLVTVDLK
jgi:hypothetical protein